MNIDKGVGMLVGLAIGDALGAPLEFEEPRHPDDYLISYTKGGAHNVSIGEWTDDTSMALAMAKSLLEKKSFDANDIMSKFCKWYKDGEFSPRGKCFDIGGTTAIALSSYLKEIVKDEYLLQPYKGRTANDTSGNGALMRLAPVIMVAQDPYHAMQLATQQTLPLDIDREDVMSGGYVKETYQCAWWAFQTTDNFEDCVIKAVNRGHDADTSGAVAGMIAGRYYGHSRIPSHFKDNLMWHDELFQTALDLCNMEYKNAAD